MLIRDVLELAAELAKPSNVKCNAASHFTEDPSSLIRLSIAHPINNHVP